MEIVSVQEVVDDFREPGKGVDPTEGYDMPPLGIVTPMNPGTLRVVQASCGGAAYVVDRSDEELTDDS